MDRITRVDLTSDMKVTKPDKAILLPGEIGATIEWFVTNKEGRVTQHQPEKRSESFVQQFIYLLRQGMENSHGFFAVQLTDTSNTLQRFANTVYIFDSNAAAGSALSGILVGSGNTAPAINNYAMETLIAHGVGAGQLQYAIVSFAVPAASATVSQFTITRNFTNGSGGAVTVNEIGLVCKTKDITYTDRYLLLIRDVVGGGISIPNGETLTVNYRPQATV